MLASTFLCWVSAVPVAIAKGSSWTNPYAIGLLVLGLLCLVGALWAFGAWHAISGPILRGAQRLRSVASSVVSAVANWSPIVWRGFPSLRTPLGGSGTLEVVRVASQSETVEVCELRASGRVLGERLPLSPPRAPQDEPPRIGLWRVKKDGLSIVADSYQLLIRRRYVGLWAEEERHGDDVQHFIGAIVDERPIQPGEEWVALKLAAGGIRRLMFACRDGTLQEFCPV